MNPLDLYAEPGDDGWDDDDRDPDLERDRAFSEAAEDAYDRWVESHMGWNRD